MYIHRYKFTRNYALFPQALRFSGLHMNPLGGPWDPCVGPKADGSGFNNNGFDVVLKVLL